jgi:catechol 2,3-dioxygenase-like lactoylglutathione lyase family enzyme
VTRLVSIVVDCHDHIAQAQWWAKTLRAPVALERPDEASIFLEDGPVLEFVPDPHPKTSKNRLHVDLATYDAAEHEQLVEELLDRGARHVDIGQRGGDWVVLADPEGNEFCVLEPRPTHGYTGALAVICLDTAAVTQTTDFWTKASGWPIVARDETWAELRAPSGRGPFLVLGEASGPKTGKLRLHLDVAPFADGDQEAEVEELVAAGARRIDIGQGDVSWVVLADPGGNEFCVLTPR